MATAAEQLAEARTARHNLVTGRLARVFMDQNGERVEFVATNIGQLDRYISQLEADVAGTRRVNRPIGFIF
jgi:hypothetical protein